LHRETNRREGNEKGSTSNILLAVRKIISNARRLKSLAKTNPILNIEKKKIDSTYNVKKKRKSRNAEN